MRSVATLYCVQKVYIVLLWRFTAYRYSFTVTHLEEKKNKIDIYGAKSLTTHVLYPGCVENGPVFKNNTDDNFCRLIIMAGDFV